MKTGSLLLRDGDRLVEAPRLGADYDLTVSGPTIRGRVTQIFHNHTENWVEAVYVYPLPEDGAVDTLKMVIGERIVVGEIKERQTARAIYEQAKADGLQDHADRAGAAEHLHQFGGQYRSRRNRAGADRIPGAGEAKRRRVLAAHPAGGRAALQSEADCADAWTSARADKAGARPPIRCRTATASSRRCSIRATNAPVNPVQITVRLQAGFPLAEVKSHHHQVTTEAVAADTQRHQAGRRPGARRPRFRTDLEIGGQCRASVGLFRERVGSDDYLLAFVTPPIARAGTGAAGRAKRSS